MTATVTIDFTHKFHGTETVETFAQIECLDGDRVESYELGLMTIQLLGIKQMPKGYLVTASVYNKGQYDNYGIIHIYTIDDETGTIRQLDDPYITVEFGVEAVGE